MPFSRTVLDNTTTLTRWLRDIQHDTSRMSLDRLCHTHEFSTLFREMKRLGQELRCNAGEVLNRENGKPVRPDADEPLQFSDRRLFRTACKLEGVSVLPADDSLRAAGAALSGEPYCPAWMQTYPDARPPDMAVDLRVPEAVWLFTAGSLLGVYLRDASLYRGAGAPGGVLLPPSVVHDAALCALGHQFAKGMFRLSRYCAAGSRCPCNRILSIYDAAPPQHPEATGALPPYHHPVMRPEGARDRAQNAQYRAQHTPTTQPPRNSGSPPHASYGRPASPTRPIYPRSPSSPMPPQHPSHPSHPSQSSQPSYPPDVNSDFLIDPDDDGGGACG